MDRRQVLGAVGALALAALIGVGANAAEKSKVVKTAKGCCGSDTCCCGSACCDSGCCGPVCCGDTCCCNSTSGKANADKNVKAAKSKSCRVTDGKAAKAAERLCCSVTIAETAMPKVTVAR
jgi:hypothetical protein